MKYVYKASVVTLATALILGFTGCGGDSSEDEPTVGVNPVVVDPVVVDTVVSYVGSLTLGGTVDTSSLSSSDQAETRSRARSSRADETEIVKLYVVDANGTYGDTGIECSVTNGAYSCPNIAGDNEYIVRYVKDLGNGRILEMKTSATVADVDPEPIKIDPITTMIVETLVKAVQEAIAGLTGDATLIEDIIKSVKTAIVDTMTTLVNSGAIKIPSLVVDGNFTAIGDANATTEVVETKNASLDDIAAIVSTSESVSADIDAVKNEAKGDEFSSLDNAAKMEAVFEALGWDEDMPNWVLALFSGEFSNMQADWTFAWFLDQSQLEAATASEINMDEHELKALKNLGITADQLATAASAIAATVNTKLTDGTALAHMKAELEKFYVIKDKAITARTAEDKKFLGEFNPIIAEMFPADFVSTMTAATPMQNMGQLMLVMGYLDTYEGYLADLIKEALKAEFGGIAYDSQIQEVSKSLFGDSGGDFLFNMYPFSGTEDAPVLHSTLAKYSDIGVSWIDGASNNHWDHDTQTELVTLRLSTGLSKLEWDIGDKDGEGGMPSTGITATLTYPKADGTTATVNMAYYNEADYGHSFFGIMPYVEDPTAVNDYERYIQNPDATQVISDFVSGDYTVEFTYEGETYSRTTQLYFVENANQYNVELVNPKGMPQWKNEWNNWDWASLTTEQQSIMDDFHAAEQAYWQAGVPTFAPNADGNTTLSGMIIKWKAPDLNGTVLPDNIALAYNVNVRLFTGDYETCKDNWEDCNTEIYSTWNDNNKLITSTSMTLPVALPENADGSNYELYVGVMFVNKDTGREIANGGGNNAQFRVGQSLALTGDEVITFNGKIELETYDNPVYTDGTTDGTTEPYDVYVPSISDTMKIALYGETYGETTDADGNTYWDSNRTLIALGTLDRDASTFTVSATWGEIKDHIGMNKNIQVIGFNDDNNNSMWEDWNTMDADGMYIGENSFWLQNWMHIDSWGDTTIRVGSYDHETETHSETSTRLKTGEDVTIDGLDMKIW